MAPIAYTVDEACSAAHAGRGTLYSAINSGALRARKRGKRTFIMADDLRAWMTGLPVFSPETAHAPRTRAAAA